ncbi:MAG: guanylate kinase [Dehalococcoidia bacterium]|nr:guanylate kinase [Dehalococcoidia bacterium]
MTITRRPVAIVLHGPSGVGKDTVIDALRARCGIHRPTSSTSRPPRDDERDGVHYHFLGRAEFERKIARGDFIEWADVYGDWKGLERQEVERPLAEGRDIIIRTDVQGARTWRERLAGAVTVLLVPEHVDAVRERLAARGSDDEAAVRRRLAEFDAEIADAPNNDYVVANRNGRAHEAVAELLQIVERERANADRPAPRLQAAHALEEPGR